MPSMPYSPFLEETTRKSFPLMDRYRSQSYFVSSTECTLSIYLLYSDEYTVISY